MKPSSDIEIRVSPDEWRTEKRKVITGAFVSLDGVMQAPGGPKEDPTRDLKLGGWVVPYVDEVFGQAINEMFGRPFELLLGRKTYEIFAAHWPYAEGGDYDFIAKRFNKRIEGSRRLDLGCCSSKHAKPLTKWFDEAPCIKHVNLSVGC